MALTLLDRLQEARDAYHELQTGRAAVSFTDQNCERVEYTRTTAPRLAAYIADLESQVAGTRRTNTLHFRTSKGL